MCFSLGSNDMSRSPLYSPVEWSRSGHGREIQFFATDCEVRQWFDQLPEEYGPYCIWGTRLIREKHKHVRELFSNPLEDWLRALGGDLSTNLNVPTQFFLRSETLHPTLPIDESVRDRANQWASVNGLVLVQHRAQRGGRRLASRIAVTDEIKKCSTGEKRSLASRAVVFDTLKNAIRRDLKYTTIQMFKDGHKEEDGVQLMSEGAAKLARQGYFARIPGRPIR